MRQNSKPRRTGDTNWHIQTKKLTDMTGGKPGIILENSYNQWH